MAPATSSESIFLQLGGAEAERPQEHLRFDITFADGRIYRSGGNWASWHEFTKHMRQVHNDLIFRQLADVFDRIGAGVDLRAMQFFYISK